MRIVRAKGKVDGVRGQNDYKQDHLHEKGYLKRIGENKQKEKVLLRDSWEDDEGEMLKE